MKVVGAINPYRVLVEMSNEELSTVTKWNAGSQWKGLDLSRLSAGEEFDLAKEFRYARDLLDSFRGIAPGLESAAARIQKLADEMRSHEPDDGKLTKGSTT